MPMLTTPERSQQMPASAPRVIGVALVTVIARIEMVAAGVGEPDVMIVDPELGEATDPQVGEALTGLLWGALVGAAQARAA